MKPYEALREDGKAFTTNNLKIDIEFLNEGYKLIIPGSTQISSTGHLPVFEIVPNGDSLPKFVSRWDQREEILDVDVITTDKNLRKLFGKEAMGYTGHHPIRLVESPRLFQVDIQIPNLRVFKGRATFNIHRRLSLTDTVSLQDNFIRTIY